MTREQLRQALIADEGLRLKPYVDTVGKITIGYGRNLTDIGLSLTEASDLLDHDIDRTVRDCVQAFPWFLGLDPARQAVLVQMAFNLGVGGLKEFTHTLVAVQRGDYTAAARGMLASRWAKQIGARAARLAAQMELGI